MRPELESALEPVLRDVSSDAVAFEIRDEDWADDENAPSALIYATDQTGTGIYISVWDSTAEQVASLAEQVQDHVIEDTQTAWPDCPRHPASHPLTAAVDGERAVWICPRTQVVVAEIGQLR